MKTKSGIIILCVNTLLCIAIALLTAFFMSGWGVFVCVAVYIAVGVGALIEFISFFKDKQMLFKSTFLLVCCAAVVMSSFVAINEVGHLNEYATTAEKVDALTEIIKGFGGWGMFAYFLIQVLQVVILPLPAAVCYVPGSLIWGALKSTLVASAGVIVGSVISYFIGKIFGKRAVVWIAGKDTTEKYSAYLSKRGKVLFVLMQILPFFPDDILCMVAGLTGMNFWFFLITIVVVRPFIIAAYCYLGSGTIIPFSGWGIAVWIAIFAVCIVLAVLSFKYQDRVERWLASKFSRSAKGAIDNEQSPTQVITETESEPSETTDIAEPDDDGGG